MTFNVDFRSPNTRKISHNKQEKNVACNVDGKKALILAEVFLL